MSTNIRNIIALVFVVAMMAVHYLARYVVTEFGIGAGLIAIGMLLLLAFYLDRRQPNISAHRDHRKQWTSPKSHYRPASPKMLEAKKANDET